MRNFFVRFADEIPRAAASRLAGATVAPNPAAKIPTEAKGHSLLAAPGESPLLFLFSNLQSSPMHVLFCVSAVPKDGKSFRICTCAKTPLQLLWNLHVQIIELKVFCNEQLQKIPGWRGSALVANAGLKGDSCCAHLHLVVLSRLTSKTQRSGRGRPCCMLRMQGDASPCYQRRRQLQPETRPETVTADLLGSIEDFKTATAVNRALGRLFALVAGNRISPRHAAVLAYIAQ